MCGFTSQPGEVFSDSIKNETCCDITPQQVSLCSGSVILIQMVSYGINEFQLLLHRARQPLYNQLDMIRMEFSQFLLQLCCALWRLWQNHENLHGCPSFL